MSEFPYYVPLGRRSVSPEGARTEAYPISKLLTAARMGWPEQIDPGTCVIKSSMGFRHPRDTTHWKDWDGTEGKVHTTRESY